MALLGCGFYGFTILRRTVNASTKYAMISEKTNDIANNGDARLSSKQAPGAIAPNNTTMKN
jgi:hypothetical protein